MTNPNDILSKPYKRELTPDESGGFTATIQEFPGLTAHGDNPTEALSSLESAAEAWLSAALETGYAIRDPQNFDDCSGKVALRLSRRLHQVAAQQAEREGTSVNTLLNIAVAHYLGQEAGLKSVCDVLREELSKQFLKHAEVTKQQTHFVFVQQTSYKRQPVEELVTYRSGFPAVLSYDSEGSFNIVERHD